MDKNMRKPLLRFKGFTDDWEQRELREISIIQKGEQLSIKDFNETGEYYVLNGGINPSGYADKFNTLADTISISEGGNSCGYVNYNKEKFWSGGHNYTLVNPSIDVKFLYQQLKSKQDIIMSLRVGSGLPNIQRGPLEEFIIEVPNKSEQFKIGQLFDQLDNLITLHQRKYDKLVNIKKSLLEKMFPQNGESIPRLRFKGFTDAWEQYKLGDLGFFKSNGVDKLSKPNEIPVNLLNYMDVYNRREVSNKNANELMQVTAKPSQLIENSVMKNDVFFTPTSETPEDIGRVYVIEETLNNTVYSYHLMRFRPKLGTYYPNFPNYSLMTENVRKQFFLAAKGVQRYVISKADFESIADTIPEYKEQAKIGEFFRSIDQLITLHQRKCDKLVNIKKALLQKMFV